MRRFISCAVTFGLAFSLFGIPGVSFADALNGNYAASGAAGQTEAPEDSSSSSSSAQPEGDPIDLDGLKDANGRLPQITGQAQIVPDETEDSAGASSDAGSAEAEQDKADFEASVLANPALADPVSTTASNEIEGSFLSVTLHTYKATSSAQSAASLKATLDGPAGFTRTVAFKAAEDDASVLVADLSAEGRIPAGDYTLKVSGSGYVTYSHSLSIANGNRMNVKLADNQEDIFLQSYGLIPYGDFDGDGKVTNADVALFVKAIASGSGSTEFDIDGNSVVDLSDLQLFAASLKEGSSSYADGQPLATVSQGPENTRKDASNAEVGKPAELSGMKLSVVREKTGGDGSVSSEEWSESGTSADLFQRLLRNALLEEGDSTVVLGTASSGSVSADDPVAVEISTTSSANGGETSIPMEGMTVSYPTSSAVEGSSAPASGKIVVEGDGGETSTYSFGNATEEQATSPMGSLLKVISGQALAAGEAEGVEVDESNGVIKVSFGKRIAVKKVKIVVTEATEPTASLVEIGKVEFLNNMADLIAPPELSVPSGIKATPATKRIDVSWSQQANVSGYELRFQMGGKTASYTTLTNSFSLCEWPYSSTKDVKAGSYSIAIRSVKGEWTSPWSDIVTCEVKSSEKPNRPTAIEVKSGYKELVVSWPAVDDAEWYNLYYKESASSKGFVKHPSNISGTTITLMNLKPDTEYILYLTASNKIGTSDESDRRVGTTYGDAAVKVPWYNLINRQVEFPGDSSVSNPVVSIKKDNGGMLDASDPVESVADGRYDTGFIFTNQNGGVFFTFDKAYNMSSIAVTTSLSSKYGFGPDGIHSASIVVTTEDGGEEIEYSLANGKLSKTSVGAEAPNTYCYCFPATKVKALKLQQGRYYNDNLAIAEVAFYEDDGLRGQLDALWADDLHTTLADGIGKAQIAAAESAVKSAVDSVSGEATPKRELYLEEIEDARNVLNNIGSFRGAKYFDSSVDNSVDRNVNGINGWQPLGISAYEGEQLEVFVSGVSASNSHYSKGDPTALKLWICQYNSESENVAMELASSLKIGSNSITVPNNLSSLDAEHGGQVYVEYISVDKGQTYGVRVLGGTEIATLDLHGITGTSEEVATERQQRCKEYVEQLEAQCMNKATRHAEHSDKYSSYADSTCIANTTDIMMDDMMYSVPASQMLASIGSGSADERAEKLEKSLASMEFMMSLFYQHKGLTDDRGGVDSYGTNNGIPNGHLNMRCMRMKDGVFMYAAGNHIGIPFGSCGLGDCEGVQFDESGKWQSGSLFGWGIAHEIGHNINQPQYTIAEVTNNYYAQLITNVGGNSRYEDQELYDHVTSGTYSPLSGRVGIGCYWQLHLAYDNYYNFKTFDSYAEQMDNLVLARMDAYARNPEAAPKGESKQIELSLDGCGTDDALARLACAATQKDLTSYFDAWGLTLGVATKEYASQFPKETRSIQYVNDAAQDYRINGGASIADSTSVSVEMSVNGESISSPKTVSSREVQLKINQSGENVSGLIGYEILRNGEAVAFQKIEGNPNIDGVTGALTYTDIISTENNCTYVYSVRAIDKTLAATQAVMLPQIKVSDDGTLADKSRWTVSTNMVSAADESYDYGDGSSVDFDAPGSCEQELKKSAVSAVIDGDLSTGYAGSLPENGSVSDSAGAVIENEAPYIEIAFNGERQITGIKVPSEDAGMIKNSRLLASSDGITWAQIPTRTQKSSDDGSTVTFYFDAVLDGGQPDPQLQIYTASSIRIVAGMSDDKSGSLSLHEIDLLGVTGDNADFLEGAAAGELATSVTYADESGTDADGNSLKGEYTIPAGSLVFLGSYKGDTAYNALKMFDQDGNLVPGTQVLFAEEPGEGRNLGTTADGRWLWYMTADDVAQYKSLHGGSMFSSVHLSLYRVDNAETLANERHVADTLELSFDEDSARANKIEIQMGDGFKDFNIAGDPGNIASVGKSGIN